MKKKKIIGLKDDANNSSNLLYSKIFLNSNHNNSTNIIVRKGRN